MSGRPPIGRAAVRGLREGFAGEIVLPGDPGYEAGRVVWNGTIDRRPAIVVRPSAARDVAAALRFAREQELVVAVRSGGHSIPGLSTCDGGIVIDLSRMRGVSVDPGARTARVNGGSLLGELDDAAQAFGLACPVGVVSNTGVAGLTLGGGMGRLHRTFGLTIDSLRAVELVTADGRQVRVSEGEHPDLFWGLRGAGANFGIATAFEFDLHPVGPMVTYGYVLHPLERARELAGVYREFVATSPDEAMATFGIGLALPAEDFEPDVAGRPIVWISAHHCGTPKAAERDFAPIRTFGEPIVDTFAPMTYLAAQHLNDAGMDWGHRFYMKSGFTASLPDEIVDRGVELMTRAPKGGDCSISIWSWGRAIGRVPEDATAFTGRDAEFWVSAEVMWEEADRDEPHVQWGRDAMKAVEPFAMTGRYVNDVAESGADVARSVYGERKFERLRALKRAWDPDNVFRLNQNVAP
jgi:FAD/FMN-containing dehydrogenase